jgi:hypothetical protein
LRDEAGWRKRLWHEGFGSFVPFSIGGFQRLRSGLGSFIPFLRLRGEAGWRKRLWHGGFGSFVPFSVGGFQRLRSGLGSFVPFLRFSEPVQGLEVAAIEAALEAEEAVHGGGDALPCEVGAELRVNGCGVLFDFGA